MIRTQKYRLYPTQKQEEIFNKILSFCCQLYNCALEERIMLYKKYNKSINYNYQQNELPLCKKEFPELKAVYAQVLRDPLLRLDKAFKSFFRRLKRGEKPGFPRFKSRDRYHSFTYSQLGFKFIERKIRLSKIGDIRFRSKKFKIKGKIKTCTISKDIDKWYASFSVEIEPELLPENNKQIGIDVGIKSFAVLSDGTIIDNPKYLKQSEKTLKRRQRILSRREKGSSNRKKARIIVAKTHRKIREQRKNFHHKISRQIINNYDTIVMENLQVNNMIKNHKLAKSISDAGWYQFRRFVSYKAESADRKVVFINPANTSIKCSNCGEKVPKTLADRIHFCPHCKIVIDRDHNAAINILNTAGIAEIHACGEYDSQFGLTKQEHLLSKELSI